MPDNKISVGLVVVFFIIAVLGVIYNLPYCASVFWFLWLLFSVPIERSFFHKKRVELGIVKANESSVCITRKQYLLLYVISGILGSILNVVGVFLSMPSYIMLGIDIVIIVICDVMHGKMQSCLHEEEQSQKG